MKLLKILLISSLLAFTSASRGTLRGGTNEPDVAREQGDDDEVSCFKFSLRSFVQYFTTLKRTLTVVVIHSPLKSWVVPPTRTRR